MNQRKRKNNENKGQKMSYDKGFQDGYDIASMETDYELEKQNENLKCCGNCKHYYEQIDMFDCEYKGANAYSYCERWTFDDMTREEREI